MSTTHMLQPQEINEIFVSYLDYFNIESASLSEEETQSLKKQINELSFLISKIKTEKALTPTELNKFIASSRYDSLNIINLKLFYFENMNLLIEEPDLLKVCQDIKEKYLQSIQFKLNLLKSKNPEAQELANTHIAYSPEVAKIRQEGVNWLQDEMAKHNAYDVELYKKQQVKIQSLNDELDVIIEELEYKISQSKKNAKYFTELMEQLLIAQSKCSTALRLDEKSCLDYWKKNESHIMELYEIAKTLKG